MTKTKNHRRFGFVCFEGMMNLAALSKDELLVILVAYKHLNKRNSVLIYTDQFKFGQESNESNFLKYLEGVKALYNRDFTELNPGHYPDRLIYNYQIDSNQRTISISFGQNVRTIYSYFKKSIENLSFSYLDFNSCYSRVLFGLLISSLKDNKNVAVIYVPDYLKLLPVDKRDCLFKGLKRACREISSKSPVIMVFNIEGDYINIGMSFRDRKRRRNLTNRDPDTYDMFNGLTENDINHYLKNILKDQYFYLLYSFAGETREKFSVRMKETLTCNSFPELLNDFENIKKVFE